MQEMISLLKPDDIKIWQKRIEFCAQITQCSYNLANIVIG